MNPITTIQVVLIKYYTFEASASDSRRHNNHRIQLYFSEFPEPIETRVSGAQGFYQYGRFQYSASYCTYCLGWSFVLH